MDVTAAAHRQDDPRITNLSWYILCPSVNSQTLNNDSSIETTDLGGSSDAHRRPAQSEERASCWQRSEPARCSWIHLLYLCLRFDTSDGSAEGEAAVGVAGNPFY